MIYRTYYLSPLGRILLAADDIGLIGVWFEGQKYFGEFPGHMNYIFEEKENHILKDALRNAQKSTAICRGNLQKCQPHSSS